MGGQEADAYIQAVGPPQMKIRFFKNAMREGFSFKHIGLALFAVLVVLTVFRTGYTYFEMKSVRDSLNTEIERLSVENKEKEARIGNLYGDKEFIERAAREQLNMVKEGETVYIISRD